MNRELTDELADALREILREVSPTAREMVMREYLAKRDIVLFKDEITSFLFNLDYDDDVEETEPTDFDPI